eukprot:8629601-Pyramimonas_sp.AAC.1
MAPSHSYRHIRHTLRGPIESSTEGPRGYHRAYFGAPFTRFVDPPRHNLHTLRGPIRRPIE